jgi:hypothetical protein
MTVYGDSSVTVVKGEFVMFLVQDPGSLSTITR